MLIALLVAAQSAAPPTIMPPMPPPIVRYPAIMPPVTHVPATLIIPPPPPIPDTVDVTVTADGRTIYRGTLRVASGHRASVAQGRNQAPAVICSGARGWDSSEREQLNIDLSRAERDRPDRFAVSVSWTRPGTATGCGPAGGRTVSLADHATIGPGASATVSGDGGLGVTLTRRR